MRLGILGRFFSPKTEHSNMGIRAAIAKGKPSTTNVQPEDLSFSHGNEPIEDEMIPSAISASSVPQPVLDLDKLQPYEFPTIKNVGKIDNNTFIKVKRQYLQAAYEAVSEYVSFVLHLTPIAKNDLYARHMEFIIKGFIGLFWDMPSSKEHHDSAPFGHLVHSLEVACRHAYTMSLHNVTNEHGLDSEQTKKQRPALVMTGFLSGLLHDSNKIFNYDLQCILPNRVEVFEPTKGAGSILDFCLVYPHRHLRKGWKRAEKTPIYYGINIFYTIVPQSLRTVMSGEMYEYIFNTIQNMKGLDDKNATKKSLQKSDSYLIKVEECLHEIFLDSNKLNMPDSLGYKISAHWVMLDHQVFLREMSKVLKCGPESLQQFLIDSGLLFVSSKGQFDFKVNTLAKGTRTSKQMTVSFLAAVLVDNVWKGIYKRNADLGKIYLPESSRASFDKLLMDPPLPKGLFLSRDKDRELDGNIPEPEEADPTPEVAPNIPDDKLYPPLYQSSEQTKLVQENAEEGNLASDKVIETSSSSPQGKTQMKPPERQNAPASEASQTDSHRPGRFQSKALESIKNKIDLRLYEEADRVAQAVLTCMANSVGVSQKTLLKYDHFQKTGTDSTIFYLLESQALYARIPHAVKFGWQAFMEAIKRGEYAWAKDIPNLPLIWSPQQIIDQKLAHHFYYVWRGIGCIRVNHNSTTFQRSNVPVNLIKSFARNNAEVEPATISGLFIELDVDAIQNAAEKPKEDAKIRHILPMDSIAFIYHCAYGQSWKNNL